MRSVLVFYINFVYVMKTRAKPQRLSFRSLVCDVDVLGLQRASIANIRIYAKPLRMLYFLIFLMQPLTAFAKEAHNEHLSPI